MRDRIDALLMVGMTFAAMTFLYSLYVAFTKG